MTDSTDRVQILEASPDDGAIQLDDAWRSAPAAGGSVSRRSPARRASAPAMPRIEVSRHTQQALLNGRLDGRALAALLDPHAAIQPMLLTEALPVDVLRRALSRAYCEARRRGDDVAAAQVLDAARMVDARRGALVERLLSDCFANYPDLEGAIVAIVEGGATRGDPEYQGIFGDIDFTVFTVEHPRALRRVSEAIATSFAWTGYPLTPNGQNRALDLHVFVQYAGQPGRPGSGRDDGTPTAVQGLPLCRQIGARNPERFVSEVGVRWIVNQMYFSGRPLRGLVERACVPAAIAPDEAVAFATDVTCHMGGALMDALAPDLVLVEGEQRRARLAAALNDAKHVLRLLDAWLISHPHGNRLYHERFMEPRHSTRGASYHSRVVQDALGILEGGQAGRVLRPADEGLLRDLAALKLRSRCPSPWDVVGHGEEGEERAADIVHDIHGLVRRLLRDVMRRPSSSAP